jgi:16S rRNA (guanine527-N7)-methyltransferase
MTVAGSISDKGRALAITPVSRETQQRLEVLVDVLQRWQKIKNLVSHHSLDHLWTRHVSDSLQLVNLVSCTGTWLDLGSGGGFPGLVIAAALADGSQTRVELVESNSRKCAFLREAARAMGVRVHVHNARIEDVIGTFGDEVQVISARALADLPQLLRWTDKLLTKGVTGLFPKGQELENELTETAKCWRLKYTIHNSLTESTGRILRVTHLESI